MTSSGTEQFCSLCYDPISGGHTDRALQHVMHEHRESKEFREFVSELRVVMHCRKCGSRFNARVTAYSDAFGAQPYCSACRAENPPMRDLMTETVPISQLIDRGHIHGETHA